MLFSSTCRQTVMLPGFVHVTGVGGFTQDTGEGGLELVGIWAGSRLDACITAPTAAVTLPSAGKLLLHVAHVERAAVIAPCCAAWVIVE